MFTSCKDDDKLGVESGKAKLTLSVNKANLKVGEKGTFTVTSNINATEAIVVACGEWSTSSAA